MIDQTYVDQRQRFLHACGNQLVGVARLLDARWMIVIHDARYRAFLQCELHDLTRVHRSSVDRAPEEIDAFNYPVPIVEQDQPEDLIVQVTQARR
jgi:hypothetical protein